MLVSVPSEGEVMRDRVLFEAGDGDWQCWCGFAAIQDPR